MSTPLPISSGIKRQSGFALVIALSLMAFVLLLLLSITSFVVVEQQSAKIAKQQLSARQNALAGLQVAIGELQVRVGPDQRATASADILDADNNPYTLVWHSDSTKIWDSTASDWVTGGDTPDFALPLMSVDPTKLGSLIGSNGKFDETQLGTDAVELMTVTNPSNGTLTALKAEKRPLNDANGAVAGNYAWVAQDESLKANLKTEHGGTVTTDANGNIIDKNHDMALPETSRRLSVFPYANAAGVTIDGDTPFSAIDPVNSDGSLNTSYFDKIEKASTLNDLTVSGIINPSSTTNKSTGEILAPYQNNFTLNSKGVLADSKNGGLRRDLSRGLDDQYFEKLHELPVFGVDRDGNVIADGINEPVGDQWKFFRDFYQFYQPIDDGLVSDLSNENIFYGISDVTATNPSVRMRITNQDVAGWTNDLYQRFGETPTYAGALTPTTVAQRDFNLTNNDWHVLTPQLRPVVLRNICNIGMKSKEITDPLDPNVGKYVLEFQVYPSFTIWNPFNVAIEFDPSTNSQNPLANGEELHIFQNGNIDLIFENQDGESFKFDLQSIAPNVTVLSDRTLSDAGLPTTLPPGAVWVCGLSQSYYAQLDGYNPRYYNDPSLTDSTNEPTLLPAAVGSTVSELNNITYTDAAETIDGSSSWEIAYFEGTDTLTLKSSGYGSFKWTGQIKSRKPSNPNSSTTFKCFSMGENSDVTGIEADIVIGEVQGLATGNAFPFNAIDFRANTTGDQGSENPAFPAFSQVNFLGSSPQIVAPDDGRGDVKALYLRVRSEASNASLTDPLPRHDSNGHGYYGQGFDTGNSGSTHIVLYDLPRHPIVSLDDFRHLMLGWNEDAQPRPIGASWPVATLSDLSNPYIRSVYPSGHNTAKGNYASGAGCDTSYYYNNTLFDSYFFSGIPSEERDNDSSIRKQTFPYETRFTQDYIDANKPLANTRLSYYKEPTVEDLRGFTNNSVADDGYEKAAAHLLIDAPFNINSTSPQAWQAILSGFRNQDIAGVNSDHTSKVNYSGNGSPFVDHFIPTADENNIYNGHRRLSDTDIESLTQSLTSEIRSRGVANTLGAFVNRSLNGSGIDQQMSRIDEAIQTAGLNSTQVHGTTPNGDRYSRPDIADSARMFDKSMVKETSAGLPGYLKQQDILRPLAPIMTCRGDTFTIRAYGESVNPTTGNPTGKAWCEAVVQRVPEYADDSTDAWDIPTAGSFNERFGRRLKIIHFRWLSSEDV